MTDDKTVIDRTVETVDSWKDQEHERKTKANKQEHDRKLNAQKLKHERLLRIGDFLKMALYVLCWIGGAGILLGGFFYLTCVVAPPSCEAADQREAEEQEAEREYIKELEEVYVECVNTMGLDKCRKIEERKLVEFCSRSQCC